MSQHQLRISQSDKNEEWYWSFYDTNSKIVSVGGEGFKNLTDAYNGALNGSPVVSINPGAEAIMVYDYWNREFVEGKLVVEQNVRMA